MDEDKNILDLRPKKEPQIKIIEKIIIQKRKLSAEFLKIIVVIAISSLIVWGISRANNSGPDVPAAPKVKNFSVTGLVSDMGQSSISINATEGGDPNTTSYTFDTSHVSTIETNHRNQISLSDIQPGYKIIAQGIEVDNGTIMIRRIISFATSTETTVYMTASSVTLPEATSSPVVVTATSTDSTSSTTLGTSSSPQATTTSDIGLPAGEAGTSTPPFQGGDTSATSTNATSTTSDVNATTSNTTTDTTPSNVPDASSPTNQDSSGSSTTQ